MNVLPARAAAARTEASAARPWPRTAPAHRQTAFICCTPPLTLVGVPSTTAETMPADLAFGGRPCRRSSAAPNLSGPAAPPGRPHAASTFPSPRRPTARPVYQAVRLRLSRQSTAECRVRRRGAPGYFRRASALLGMIAPPLASPTHTTITAATVPVAAPNSMPCPVSRVPPRSPPSSRG